MTLKNLKHFRPKFLQVSIYLASLKLLHTKNKICTIPLFIFFFVGSKFTLFVTHCLFYLSLFHPKVSCYYIDPFSCEFLLCFSIIYLLFAHLRIHFLSIFKSEYFVFVHFFYFFSHNKAEFVQSFIMNTETRTKFHAAFVSWWMYTMNAYWMLRQ